MLTVTTYSLVLWIHGKVMQAGYNMLLAEFENIKVLRIIIIILIIHGQFIKVYVK